MAESFECAMYKMLTDVSVCPIGIYQTVLPCHASSEFVKQYSVSVCFYHTNHIQYH